MIKAVIFDLDDTLISEKEYIESGYRHISKILSNKLNIGEKIIYKLLFELLSINSKNVLNRLLDRIGVSYTNEDILGLVTEYRAHHPNISFFNDVIPILEHLKKNNIKTGIITDGYANAQRQKLNAVNALKYFKEVIVTDELGRDFWKPHPKAFEVMRDKLSVEYDEMMYVGDNPEKDFYIGKVIPIKTVRIIRKQSIYKDKKYLYGHKENHMIDSLGNLIQLLIYMESKD
ncbi:HAD-IA family hydrolase [Virgibacillus halodenitrificans]|nr:HAD-IA family hydrolase [Virgibacillus halodenitrificans]